MYVLLFSCQVVPDSVISWTVACQAPLFMGYFRQEYWSELPFPSPGDLPEPGIEPTSPALAGGFFNITELPEKPHLLYIICSYCTFLHKWDIVHPVFLSASWYYYVLICYYNNFNTSPLISTRDWFSPGLDLWGYQNL